MSGSGLRVGSLFITGANRGIGLEFVKQLTQLPQPPKHIFVTCRNPDAAEVWREQGALVFLVYWVVTKRVELLLTPYLGLGT